MICDLCIVQLNVSYNFKRQSVSSDIKLRQILIEKGIGEVNRNSTGLQNITTRTTTTIYNNYSPSSLSVSGTTNTTNTTELLQIKQERNTDSPTYSDVIQIESDNQRRTPDYNIGQRAIDSSPVLCPPSMVVLHKEKQPINDREVNDNEFIRTFMIKSNVNRPTDNPVNKILANRKNKNEQIDTVSQRVLRGNRSIDLTKKEDMKCKKRRRRARTVKTQYILSKQLKDKGR